MGIPGVMGMEYFPHKVTSVSQGRLTIGKRTYTIAKGNLGGELESGRMSNITAHRGLAAVYDYRGIAAPDQTGHVKFKGRGIGSGKKGMGYKVIDKAFDKLAWFLGTRQFGFDANGINHEVGE